FRSALRAAVAAILIVWLAYYFNAPNWWQIWTHLFLYGFLLIDLLDRRMFGNGRLSLAQAPFIERLRRMQIAPQRLILLFMLALMIPHTNGHLIKYMIGFMHPDWLDTGVATSTLSGITMPKPMADLLERKARKLSELQRTSAGSLVYL